MIDNVSLRPKTDLKHLQNLPENEVDEFLTLLGASDFIIKPNVKKRTDFLHEYPFLEGNGNGNGS